LQYVELLLAKEPRNHASPNLKASILANAGDYGDSIKVYEAVLKDFPHPKVWMSYGHSLKTQRRQAESITAYRRAIELQPTPGESYWSLANLKTFRFEMRDVQAMREALARPDLPDDDRLHFEFALGKALEDAGDYEASFEHYSRGNALRKKQHQYNSDDNSRFVCRSKAVFTADFFASRAAVGAEAPDPIFIVGLPRAGSTLIEQILSSHSAVEGTMELPDLTRIAAEIFRREVSGDARGFAHAVAGLTPQELRALGERYLQDTRSQRESDRPFFIDKMPNNWMYVPLIHLMLPNAKIIDARRHPLGCCFSGFKQNFARGQSFTYSLDDLGRYYGDYVELMALVDTVLPGRVHRVFHEKMIDETESQMRELLGYCRLPFEEACLRFYENERAVRTASSEQVRRPIFRDGVDHWRHCELWLQPLKDSLRPVLDAYPGVPAFPSSSDLKIL
jgi:tetratricopeptide (TPR) repeat protein